MKTETMIVLAAAASAGGYLIWKQSQAQAAAAAPKAAAPPVTYALPVRKSTVLTAPVVNAKPLAVKTPSTAQKVLTVGANAAAQYGCSYLTGFQKELCLQGSGIVTNGLTSLKLF